MRHPSIPALTSFFLLPLLPCCPALSSQHSSPINPPFSLLILPLRHLKTGVLGIAKTLIFDQLNQHHHSASSPVSVSRLRAAFMLLPSLPLEVTHAWSPQGSMDMLPNSKYSLPSLLSICKHALHLQSTHLHTRTLHPETSGRSSSLSSRLPTSISWGVNGGFRLPIGDFNSILTHRICLRFTGVKYAIGCFPLVTLAATGFTSNGLFSYRLKWLF